MNLFVLFISFLLIERSICTNVCQSNQCTCKKSNEVHCDNQHWRDLSNVDFPTDTETLTLNNNELKFDSDEDRMKISNLTKLRVLSLNGNPLGSIPNLNLPLIQSLLLEDTSLRSAQFPPIYTNSHQLRTISLDENEINQISADDFLALKDSRLDKLSLDDNGLTKIDQNAFSPLIRLQSLSLAKNRLKSFEFLLNSKRLSSIKLDENHLTSLPDELAVPQQIQSYSFKDNLISVIGDSSPLASWEKSNVTNRKIYLTNNSFDCCQSLWFIGFLNRSSNLVGDASILTCAQPVEYRGKKLVELRNDQMNCGTIHPTRSNWKIIVASVVSGVVLLLLIVSGTIFVILKRKKIRSGYTEIEGFNEPAASDPVFPPYGDDNDDQRSVSSSVAPTISTDINPRV